MASPGGQNSSVKAPGRRISLRLLMTIVAVISVCLAIARFAPWLGVPLAIVLAPAVVRTSFIMQKRRAAGLSVNGDERLLAFMASAMIMVLTLVAAGVAFCCTCFPIGLAVFDMRSASEYGMYWAIGVGVSAAAAVSYFLLRRLWPQRRPLVNHWPGPPFFPVESPAQVPPHEPKPPETAP